MAIDLKPVSNISVNNTVSDKASRTVSPSPNRDIEKVPPVRQVQPNAQLVISDTQVTSANELDPKSIDDMVSELNKFVEQHKRDIRFSVDKDSSKTIVKLLDSNGDVLKQIPSEEVLAILKGIENNKGLFLKYEA